MKYICECGATADGTWAYWVRRGADYLPFYETCVRIWVKDGRIIGTEMVHGSSQAPYYCIECLQVMIKKKANEAEAARAMKKLNDAKAKENKVPWWKFNK